MYMSPYAELSIPNANTMRIRVYSMLDAFKDLHQGWVGGWVWSR